jgi:hypothetical protein
MTACLIKSEIALYAPQIKKEFKRLLENPRLAVRPHSKQWEFFQHCFDVLMGEAEGDFKCGKANAVDYRLEISQKLKQHYSRTHDEAIRFKFGLVDKKRKGALLDDNYDYTCTNDYLLVIVPTDPELNTVQQIRDILSRAVDDAIHAEFNVYNKLPDRDFTPLKGCFDLNGSAYREICERVKAHHKNKEIISNDGNPSTRPQLRKLEVKELDKQSAKVSVVEYWNLQWLSTRQNVYVKTWEGQNRQTYILIKDNARWLVHENLFRRPRGPIN